VNGQGTYVDVLEKTDVSVFDAMPMSLPPALFLSLDGDLRLRCPWTPAGALWPAWPAFRGSEL